jgi:hypothetical protein
MDYFTSDDHFWFIQVCEFPGKYKIVLDNDSIWVETIDDEPKCAYTFNSYGYHFIHALFFEMGINVEYC